MSQVAPVEGTSEGKPAAAVDIETATKCLPFKNPNFVVRVFSQKVLDVLVYISIHSQVFPPLALRYWWSSSREEE